MGKFTPQSSLSAVGSSNNMKTLNTADYDFETDLMDIWELDQELQDVEDSEVDNADGRIAEVLRERIAGIESGWREVLGGEPGSLIQVDSGPIIVILESGWLFDGRVYTEPAHIISCLSNL